MDSRKSLDPRAIALMLLICSIWAIQQIGLKVTAQDAAPALQIGIRSGIAALCVLLFVFLRHERITITRPVLLAGIGAGLLFSTEFILVGESIRFTTASHTVVFLYTAPIFAGLGLHLKLPTERLAPMQWAGIAIAAIGISIAFLGHEQASAPGLSSMLLGDLMALAAGAMWGMTTFLIRTSALSRIPGAHTLFYQLATAFVVITSAALIMGQGHVTPTLALGLNIAFQALVVSFFSFLVWFYLLTQYKASQLGVFSFTTPLMGVVLGHVLLNEPLSAQFLIGAACVLSGIIAVSAYPWIRQRQARQAV